MEIKIPVSSESSRNIDNNNLPSKFKTIFDKPLTLDQNKTYVFGLDKIETMTYSWYSISEQYNNNKLNMGLFHEKRLIIIIFIFHQEVIVTIISMNISKIICY